MFKKHPIDTLTIPERALAEGALQKQGRLAVDYTLREDGGRSFNTPLLRLKRDFNELVGKFREDPKTSLGYMRRNLFAVGADSQLGSRARYDRLQDYLGAYTELTVTLDHAAFGAHDKGQIHEGVPDYIQDGMIDMGTNSATDPMMRKREQIKVDKAAIYEKYRDVLTDIFSTDTSELSNTQLKYFMIQKLLQGIHARLGLDLPMASREGTSIETGVVNLHDLSEGVCRHHALTLQVLAQACGLTSRYVKCRVDGVKHAVNAVRVDNQWYLIDPTIPDNAEPEYGQGAWRPTMFAIDHKPETGEVLSMTERLTGDQRDYSVEGTTFWRMAT